MARKDLIYKSMRISSPSFNGSLTEMPLGGNNSTQRVEIEAVVDLKWGVLCRIWLAEKYGLLNPNPTNNSHHLACNGG